MKPLIPRVEIIARLKDSLSEGSPILATGCSAGIIAKCAELGGADLIVVYSTGKSRLMGLPTTRLGDSNAITLSMADEILNVVKNAPVIGGIEATDPTRLDLRKLLNRFVESGYSGIINFPTLGLWPDQRRRGEKVNLGFKREVDIIRLAREKNIFTMAYVASFEDAVAMVDAGVDCLVAHTGPTEGGLIGFDYEGTLEKATVRVNDILKAAEKRSDDIICLAHGGPISAPSHTAHIYQHTPAVGFVAASSIERIPVEAAVTQTAQRFKGVSLSGTKIRDSESPSILIITTMDTKGEEALLVKQKLASCGVTPISFDVGIFPAADSHADITREQFAADANIDFDTLQKSSDIGGVIDQMAHAVAEIILRLCETHAISGVIGLGGGKGTAIASVAMRALPFGLPKLMVTSASPGNAKHFIGDSDVLLFFSPADMMGVNPVTQVILNQAADAMVAMAKGYQHEGGEFSRYIAISSFGVTTPAVLCCKKLIESNGYQTVIYPASGFGGRAMEKAIGDGNVLGVLDLTTTELADELLGGIASAGKNRLEAAGKMGVPQVVVPGALDMVNFGPMETVPPKYTGRRFYRHSPQATVMRTTPEENEQLGMIMAEKLNQSDHPTAVVVPLGGFSAYDDPTGHWPDPEADDALIRSLKSNLSPKIEYVEIDSHINSEDFCKAVVEVLLRMLSKY